MQKTLFSAPRYQSGGGNKNDEREKQLMDSHPRTLFSDEDILSLKKAHSAEPDTDPTPLAPALPELYTPDSRPIPLLESLPHPLARSPGQSWAGDSLSLPSLVPSPAFLEAGVEEKEKDRPRYTGTLKFFDENKNYGFIILDGDGSEVFVHYDDLSKANLAKEYLRTAKLGNQINLSFSCFKYIGKHDESVKAVDLQLLPN